MKGFKEWSDIIRTAGKDYNFSIIEYGKTKSLGKRHCSFQGKSCPMAQLTLNSNMRVCFHNCDKINQFSLIHIQKILLYSYSASMYPLLEDITTFMLSFKLLFHTSYKLTCMLFKDEDRSHTLRTPVTDTATNESSVNS